MKNKQHLQDINLIVLHCSDSDNPDHDSITVIDQWHREKGWRKVGYHYFIRKDGTVETGRFLTEIGAHTKGANENSIGICLAGQKEFTQAQADSLAVLIMEIKTQLGNHPIEIKGHRDFAAYKTCPNFNIEKMLNGEIEVETQ